MSTDVAEGAAPEEQVEGLTASTVLRSLPQRLINKRGSAITKYCVGNAIAGVPNGTAVGLSTSSESPGLYRDTYAAAPKTPTRSKASTSAVESKGSHTRRGGSLQREQEIVAVVKKHSPPLTRAAAHPLGSRATAEEAAVCSKDKLLPDSPVLSGDVLNTPIISRMNTTHAASPPGSSRSVACSAAFVEPSVSTSTLAEENDVLCVELPAMPPPYSSRMASAVGGERLDLHMRGLGALPCLHASAASAQWLPAAGHGKMAVTSAHRSGDVRAGRLHTVSFRQNSIRSIDAQGTPVFAAAQAASFTSCGSPLQCYTNLSSLDLSHNALTSITGIGVLKCLRTLRVAFNRLTSLAPLWASPFVADLGVLDVSSNALTELISAEDVNTLRKNCILTVTHPQQGPGSTNDLCSVNASTYKSTRLRVLYASNNRIREVPSAIYTFQKLTDLRLRNNVIESVPDGFPVCACLPQLSRLDLSMNELPAAIVEAAVARTRKVPEVLLPAHATSIVVPPFQRTKGHVDASARRPRRSSNPSGGEDTAADSWSPSMTMRGASRMSSDLTGKAAVRRAESGRDNQRLVSGKGEVEGGVRAIHNYERCRSLTSGASLAGVTDSHRNRSTLLKAKGGVPTPIKSSVKMRREGVVGRAPAPPIRKASPPLPDVAPAAATESPQEALQQDTIQCIAENVYSIDLSRWSAVMRQRLEEVLHGSSTVEVSGALGAKSPCSMREHLLALCDSPAWNSSGGGVTNHPRNRAHLATTSHTVAALLHCLPSCSLVYSEGAHVRCPPVLFLTGITAGAAADQNEFLFHEVLAHHIVQNCLRTVKSDPDGASSPFAKAPASPDASMSADLPSPQSSKNERIGGSLLRAKALATDHAKGGEPTLLRPGIPVRGRGGVTTRQLSFALPLQVIHVMDCTDSVATSCSTTSAMWKYITWRQCWESAVSRRRFLSKNAYVCQLGKQDAAAPRPLPESSPTESPTAAVNGHGTPAALRHGEASPLYPFSDNSPVPRILEWRWLHEHKPASYCAVPPAWDLLYNLLLRPSSPPPPPQQQQQEHTPAMLPLLNLASSSAHHMCGAPAHLACAQKRGLNCLGCAQGSSLRASSSSLLRRRPPSPTDGSASGGVSNGTSPTTPPLPPSEDFICHALQWLRDSQQLSRCVESEVSTVAAEQVTVCDIPLYSPEEVHQSQQAAVVALSSLNTRNGQQSLQSNGHDDFTGVTRKNTAASGEDVFEPTLHSCVLAHSPPQRLHSSPGTAAPSPTELSESETETLSDTALWGHES
ncbi:hypothetical protein JKF63_07463 [Porcisia hertigi]|uniref:Uncharacterized protein n=1 Tax=Porcisia hertigi TaxID=2761500 RepID=A0A836IZK6_9TRYP|nr:hypothetical protein JKF63_07463 [Porcisia hertigi]